MAKNMQQKKLKLQIDPKNEGGVYSNIVTALHSETEFILDFGMFLPGRDAIRVGSRIIISPRTAKQLLIILNQNVQKYESQFGEIKLPNPRSIPTPMVPEIAQ